MTKSDLKYVPLKVDNATDQVDTLKMNSNTRRYNKVLWYSDHRIIATPSSTMTVKKIMAPWHQV